MAIVLFGLTVIIDAHEQQVLGHAKRILRRRAIGILRHLLREPQLFPVQILYALMRAQYRPKAGKRHSGGIFICGHSAISHKSVQSISFFSYLCRQDEHTGCR